MTFILHLRTFDCRVSNKEKRNQEKDKPRVYNFDALWVEYIAAKGHLKGITQQRYQYFKHIKPYFGSSTPEQLTARDLDHFRSKLFKAHYSPQSIKHYLSQIHRLVTFGVTRGLCKPLDFKIEYPKFDNKKTENLTIEQRNSLLNALDEEGNHDLACFLKVVMFTGMRKMEVLKLKWSDVDLDKHFILIRAPKGVIDERVPINDHVKSVFKSMKGKYDSEYVFPSPRGGIRERGAFKRQLKRIKEKAGLPNDFRMVHGLRHAYASFLAEQGVDLYTIQKLLGHKEYRTTQRYAHLSDRALRKASDIADQMVSDASII